MSKLKNAINKCRSDIFICITITILSFCGAAHAVVCLSQSILEVGIGNMSTGVLHLNVFCVFLYSDS